MPKITKEMLEGAEIFEKRLRKCLLNAKERHQEPITNAVLNYVISTMNIHLQLMTLDWEMEVNKEAKNK